MKYYKRNGEPYPEGEKGLKQWGRDTADPEKKTVKQEVLPNGKFVSTVWMGIDHSFGEGPPLIFETMVFPEKGNWSDVDMERYSTEEEAIKGHEEMVRKHSKSSN